MPRRRPNASAEPALAPAWRSRDGASQLFCADQQTLLACLPAESVDCIWTDPPYFLSNDGYTCVAGKRRKVNKGPDRYVFNYDAMKTANDGRQMKNVWRFPAPGALEKQHGRHPTQKPLALIERCLEASTLPGQRVLDPFAGSGSTGVAALRLGREFIGCELEPRYATLAAARLGETDHAS